MNVDTSSVDIEEMEPMQIYNSLIAGDLNSVVAGCQLQIAP